MGHSAQRTELVQTQDKPQAAETPTAAPTKTLTAKPRRSVPVWASFSVALNGLLLLAISLGYWKPHLVGLNAPTPIAVEPVETAAAPIAAEPQSLPYSQWLDILGKEAKAVAQKNPDRLTVLLGDSLTLWFPRESLPENRHWLNQGISGESTAGLLKRLNLLDDLKPQTILVMIGVNDLIKGNTDESLITNYQKLIDELKARHPKAEIVLQSILPHGGDRLSVIDREQVLQVANDRITQVNRKLETLATQKAVKFLNLHSLFVDREGLLRSDLSTDGLHLNPQGYATWQTAMQTFDQLSLKQPVAPAEVKAGEAKVDEVKPDVAKPDVAAPEAAAPEAPAPEAPAKLDATPPKSPAQ
jgi:lysophospholipase L1-like esterase